MRDFIESDIGKFVFDSVLEVWYKIIDLRGSILSDGWEVDVVRLTPYDGNWTFDGRVGKIEIRSEALNDKDLVVNSLPKHIREKIIDHGLESFL
jgi:hypothetical protein